MILDKLAKLAPREKIGLALAAAALFLLVVNQFVVLRFVNKLKELKTQIVLAEYGLKENKEALRYKDQVDKDYEEVRSLIAEGTSRAGDIDDMKREIDELASEAGLRLVSWQEQEPRKGKFCDEYVVEVGKFEVENMKDFLEFIDSVARNEAPGVLRIARLQVSGDNKSKHARKGTMLITKVTTAVQESSPDSDVEE